MKQDDAHTSHRNHPLIKRRNSKPSHHLYSVNVYNHLKKILESIGLGSVRFHDLRHCYAAISLQNGDDIKTVSENLGHATVAFTLDVYGHVTEKMKKDSADRMQAYIESL